VSGPSARQQTTYGANLDRARYLRVVWFLGRVFLHVLWWDYLLRKIFPDSWPARTAESRWRRLSRRYRVLAVDMGGVLIKLGQFLSIRVDILPRAITDELIGLQDEVPAERLADVLAVIEEEFQQPANTIFDELEGVPLGAASLAQVHRARLPGDEEVVVKVQRPRIRVLVETDLASVRFGLRFLKLFRGVTRRADLDRLFAEFATITRAELDFEAEGRNAERFAANFAADRGVYVPKVHWDFTRPRVLTMENVSGIKITDFRAIDAAGVSRPQLAAKLYNVYLRQVFVLNFIHADPHPGNLFVHTQPPRQVEDGSGDAFRLVFVDFGMMAVVPERIRRHLREYIIGFGTRDSARVVRAYAGAGILLPGADLKRIEQAQSEVFSRFWGVRMGEIQKIAFSEARQFAYEYRDLIHEMPFQVPADMLFVGRALGILSGLATELDPAFDIWTATIPFAQQLAAEEETQGQLRAILAELGRLVRPLLTLPGQIERFLGQVTAGELRLQYSLAPDASKAIQRLEAAIARLTWGVIFGGTLLAGVLLRALEGPSALSSGLFIAAGLALLLGLTLR
jgi:predicted unusual protein kinase regulating ubiquinone biosynthesis (AarF/ABC1/UbiB family)